MILHDDDVLYYMLFRDGKLTDCYDSCPAYFDPNSEPTPLKMVSFPMSSKVLISFGSAEVEDTKRGRESFPLTRSSLTANLLAMPRRARSIQGGLVYHVLNRSNGRVPFFRKEEDYAVFERVLEEAHQREPLRILAYCVLPNHWHMVVWPKQGADGQVSEFLRWLTVTHTQRRHAQYHTSGSGHLYQGRFKSFPIEADEHLYSVLRYVERNAVRTNLVSSADEWRWSSVWRFYQGDAASRAILSNWPIARPVDWLKRVNRAETKRELEWLRRCVQRGQPFGSVAWGERIIERLGLESTIRPPGRPKKPLPK